MSSAGRRVCGRRFKRLVPDVEKEVYAALWNVVRSGKKIEHPTSYLYKVALTTALTMVRKNTPDMRTITLEDGENEIAAMERKGFGALLPAERERLLAQVLEQLPPEERRAVSAYLAGFGHAEV